MAISYARSITASASSEVRVSVSKMGSESPMLAAWMRIISRRYQRRSSVMDEGGAARPGSAARPSSSISSGERISSSAKYGLCSNRSSVSAASFGSASSFSRSAGSAVRRSRKCSKDM